ncbi:MAG: helix-turn-helix domain-containing protein [Pseudomonadota bacterium]
MKEKTEQTVSAPREACGMAQAVERVGDRWTLLILREALFGVNRFDQIQASLKCPRTILSERLKRLCKEEILATRPYKVEGQRTRKQYVLTGKGVELALPMIALMQWGDKYCLENAPATELVERQTGAECKVGLVSAANRPVGLGETQLRGRATN